MLCVYTTTAQTQGVLGVYCRIQNCHHLVLKRDKVFQVHGLGDDVEEAQIQHPQAFRTDLYAQQIKGAFHDIPNDEETSSYAPLMRDVQPGKTVGGTFSGDMSVDNPRLRDGQPNGGKGVVSSTNACLSGCHLHDNPDYLRLGEKRAETEVSRSLLEIVKPDEHGALLS